MSSVRIKNNKKGLRKERSPGAPLAVFRYQVVKV